jgi:hypothetical protein
MVDRHFTPLALMVFCIMAFSEAYEKNLVDFNNNFSTGSVSTNDAQVSLVNANSGKALRVAFGHTQKPRISFSLSGQDLSTYVYVTMNVHNVDTQDAAVLANLNDADWINGIVLVHPGETKTLSILLKRLAPPAYITKYLTSMNGIPGGYVWLWSVANYSNVNKISVYEIMPKNDCAVVLDSIKAQTLYALPDTVLLNTTFFPFIDTFGQYKYWDWPGKTKSAADLSTQNQSEQTDLTANPGPTDWDEYGGWSKGPTLTVTGHFRVEKYQNKWWLVDPRGFLFWSAGIDCISSSTSTPTTGRENYFSIIPSSGNFFSANLAKKYGQNWSGTYNNLIHQRLRSWGINTFGNWSTQGIYLLHKTPYTVALSSTGVAAATSNNAAFRTDMASRMAGQASTTASDPWCIGYFVDNEIHDWGDGSQTTIETYYRTVNEEIKKVAPSKLYLGSRLDYHDWSITGSASELTTVRAAAKFCDIVSFNRYQFTANDLIMPSDVDKPVIIGEFHWGALDRGLPHTGLRSVGDQEQRGRAYENYIRTALDNPSLVGAHWFQYIDEPFTGRGDGENYQIGFVDVCDKPYPEMVTASRAINYNLYQYRTTGTVSIQHSPSARPAGLDGGARTTSMVLFACAGKSSVLPVNGNGPEKMISLYDLSGRLLKKAYITNENVRKLLARGNMHGVYILKIEDIAARPARW